MAELPTGTVTFLYTDIEGSTKRWESSPTAMKGAVERHDAILREAIEAHGGHVFRTEGDAFRAAFRTAPQALRAALGAQRALYAEPWSREIGAIQVRMALHTGEVEVRDGDYVGPSLNRMARLLSTAHGGQTLLSLPTEQLVRDSLPPGVTLLNKGEHRLKDLIRSERIFQLVTPDLPSDFPPLNTPDNRPNNLPIQATPFIGREKELADIAYLLGTNNARLLTLTGPGGMGKTRLGLEVARALLDSSNNFKDGLFFIALAPVSEPTLVASTIAQALGVVTGGGQSVVESLKNYLGGKELLLLLDNFEQVMEAAPLVGELLSSAPKLKVLATSREALHLYGEREFPVPPLDLPDLRHLPPLEQLTQYEAVRLFIERATLVKADFAVTNDNAPAVAEICYRLDGLPLAIELAAARVKLLPPQAMLQRLQSRLKVLTGGARDLPARQQTLRGAIEWSYDLLGDEERKLFRRMSAFTGGCTLEAIEAVCNVEGDVRDVLDAVSSLADKSLLKQQEGAEAEARFWMLETIREYALERLEDSDEARAIQRQHADFYLALSEEAELHLFGSQRLVWLDRLEVEHDNIRVALRWLLEQGDAESALRTVGALYQFWVIRGYLFEGRKWVEEALTLPKAGERTAARAIGLAGAASMAWPQGDFALGRLWSEESAAIFRELGDTNSLGGALTVLAVCTAGQGDFITAGSLFEEALAISRESGPTRYLVLSLMALGQMAAAQGDYPIAHTRLEEAVAQSRAIDNRWDMAQALNSLGDLARLQSEYARAEQLYEESLALFREAGAKGDIPASLHNLGHVALAQGDYEQARALFEESLALHQEVGNKPGIVEGLAGLAGVAAMASQHRASDGQTGEAEQARKAGWTARLFGASDALRGAIGAPMWPAERVDYERNMAAARAQLDEEEFERAWQEGRSMTIEQAIAYALEET